MKYIIEQAKLEDAKEIDNMLTSLIQELVKWAKEQGASFIELSVCQENEKTLHL